MRNNKWPVMLLCLLAGLSCGAAETAKVTFDITPPVAEWKNLVSNPSFETVGAEGVPGDWAVKVIQGKGKVDVVSEQAFTGTRALQFIGENTAFSSVAESSRFPVKPGAAYLVDYAYNGTGKNPALAIVWLSAEEKEVGRTECAVAGNAEAWSLYSLSPGWKEIVSPPNACFGFVRILGREDGRIRYDHVVVRPSRAMLSARVALADINYVKLFEEVAEGWRLLKDSGRLPPGTNEYKVSTPISTSLSYALHTLSKANMIGGLDEPDIVFLPQPPRAVLEEQYGLKLAELAERSKGQREPPLPLLIDDVPLAPKEKVEESKEGVHPNALNIAIKDGLFLRDGKPVFLMGGEATTPGGPFSTARVLSAIGIDFAASQGWAWPDYNVGLPGRGNERVAFYNSKDGKPKMAHVFYSPPHTALIGLNGYPHYPYLIKQSLLDWPVNDRTIVLEEILKDTARYGVGVVAEISPSQRENPLHQYFPELFVNWDKCFGYDIHNPLGWRLRTNYYNLILNQTRKYPMLAYEVFNEVGLVDGCPTMLEAFGKRMKAKYGDIQRANSAWGKNFLDFDHLEDPLTMFPKREAVYARVTKANFSNTYWCDFKVFNEEWTVSECFKRCADYIRKHDPRARVLIQSHCNLHYDYRAACFGVNPYLKAKVEDIYGAQNGIVFGPHKDSINYDYLYEMALRLMEMDIVREAAAGKPIYNAETDAYSLSTKKFYKVSSPSLLLDLHGEWDFRIDPKNQGEQEGWEKKGAGAEWEKIMVPGTWEEKLPKYKEYDGVAWYRKRFAVPAKLAGKYILLVGDSLDDTATVYLNGELIQRTKTYNERFAVNVGAKLKPGVENEIVIRIEDLRDGGGIAKFIGLAGDGALQVKAAWDKGDRITGAMQRSAFWSRFVHGQDATVPMYWYVSSNPQGSFGIFNPTFFEIPDALLAIPKTRLELNSLGGVAFAKPRIKGRIALVYPFEYLRFRATQEWKSNNANYAILDFYIPAIFSHVPVDVINNDLLLKKDLASYQMVMLPLNLLALPGTVEKLDAYVRSGGIVLLGYGSLGMDAQFYGPIPTPGFFGVEIGKAYAAAQRIRFQPPAVGESDSIVRKADASYGVRLALKGATALAATADGTPCLTVNTHGKGRVYYFGCRLAPDAMRAVFNAICAENSLKPEVRVAPGDAKQLDCLETHLLGKDGRYVLYAMNWGLPGRFNIGLELPAKNYRLRDIATRRVLQTPDGSEAWSAAQLKDITLDIGMFSASTLLLEEESLAPTPLDLMGKDQEQFLRELLSCENNPGGGGGEKIRQTLGKYRR